MLALINNLSLKIKVSVKIAAPSPSPLLLQASKRVTALAELRGPPKHLGSGER